MFFGGEIGTKFSPSIVECSLAFTSTSSGGHDHSLLGKGKGSELFLGGRGVFQKKLN